MTAVDDDGARGSATDAVTAAVPRQRADQEFLVGISTKEEERTAMAYEGDLMVACPVTMYDFAHTTAVVVSGDGPNFCGHLILNIGGKIGVYVHVAGLRTEPRKMDEDGYRRYLKETAKKELRRFPVSISYPARAMLKLEQLLSEKWTWGVLPHNCASFVEEIVGAGGSSAGLFWNCPALEQFQ
jgi:hypothetical protein